MSSFVPSLLAATLAALTVTPPVSAQLRGAAPISDIPGILAATPAPGPQATLDAELQQMASQAGVIFAGQVLAVRPQVDLAWGSASGWVEIDFRVDQAILGCLGQSTYTLREWSGLWSGGVQRYTVGQNLLMLLHAPSASGLSSPVGGQLGAIPLTGVAAAPRPEDSFDTATEQAVDVRWLQAGLLRTAASPSQASSQTPTTRPTGPHGMVSAVRERVPLNTRKFTLPSTAPGRRFETDAVESPTTVPLAAAGQGITLRSILAMLTAWRAEHANAAR